MNLLVIDPPIGCIECCFVTVRTIPDPDVECMLTGQVVRDYILDGKKENLKPIICPLVDYEEVAK